MQTPNQFVKQLTAKFHIQAAQMEYVQRGVYKIKTANGRQYCLKRMAYPLAQLRWIDRTLQRVRRKNKHIRMVWRNPRSRTGKKLYAKAPDGTPYVFTPWLNGQWPSPASRTQMEACGRLLARFHQTGSRIHIPVKGRNNGLGTWPAYLHEELIRLQQAVRKARRNGYDSPLDQLLQTHGAEIVQMARQSLQALRNSRYKALCRHQRGVLCHGDYGLTNLIRTTKGIHIIDFETLRIDLRAYDLYRGIFNTCQVYEWKFSTAKSFLDGYQQITKLNRSDFTLLKVWLRFPRGICKYIQNYSSSPDGIKHQIERDFSVILAHERNRGDFLRKLDKYRAVDANDSRHTP